VLAKAGTIVQAQLPRKQLNSEVVRRVSLGVGLGDWWDGKNIGRVREK
jgi:hypothetical protein